MKKCHRKRGAEAVNVINIIASCDHSLRNLKYIEQANHHNWAIRIRRLLLDICQAPADAETKILCETRFEKVSRRCRAILNEGKKGPIHKSESEKLLLAFVDCKREILRFGKRREAPFINNRSERDIRMAKVKL